MHLNTHMHTHTQQTKTNVKVQGWNQDNKHWLESLVCLFVWKEDIKSCDIMSRKTTSWSISSKTPSNTDFIFVLIKLLFSPFLQPLYTGGGVNSHLEQVTSLSQINLNFCVYQIILFSVMFSLKTTSSTWPFIKHEWSKK